MKYSLLIAAVIGSSVLVGGCKKNNDKVEDETSSNVAYHITTINRSSELGRIITGEEAGATNRTAGTTITWTDGYVTTSEIKFEAKGDNKVEFKSKAVQRVNLFDAIASIGSIAVFPGTYDKIEFKTSLEPAAPYAAFELTGYYMKDGVPFPVTVRFDDPIEFKFEKKTPTIIDGHANFDALNILALDLLTSGITVQMLNSAVVVNNTIVISSASNPTLYNIMWNSFGGMVKVEIKKN